MRYCGQCGADLDDTARARGVCPSCQMLISREGDVIVPLAVPDVPLARESAVTLPDDDTAAFAPSPSDPGAPRWPKPLSQRAAVTPAHGMRWQSVLALVILVAMAALSVGFLLKGHLHLRDRLHNWFFGTPTPRPTAPSALRAPVMPACFKATQVEHWAFGPSSSAIGPCSRARHVLH